MPKRHILSDEEVRQKHLLDITSTAFRQFVNPTEYIKKLAVRKNPSNIRYIKDPSPEVQMIAIRRNYKLIHHIEHPCVEAVVYAVMRDYGVVDRLKNISDEALEEVVKIYPEKITVVEHASVRHWRIVVKRQPSLVFKHPNPDGSLKALAMYSHVAKFQPNRNGEMTCLTMLLKNARKFMDKLLKINDENEALMGVAKSLFANVDNLILEEVKAAVIVNGEVFQELGSEIQKLVAHEYVKNHLDDALRNIRHYPYLLEICLERNPAKTIRFINRYMKNIDDMMDDILKTLRMVPQFIFYFSENKQKRIIMDQRFMELYVSGEFRQVSWYVDIAMMLYSEEED